MADKNSGKSLITGRESSLAKKKREKEREKKREKEREAAIKRERKRQKKMWEEMESEPDRSSQKSYTRRGGPKVGADKMFREMDK